MFTRVEHFITNWKYESGATLNLMRLLTDETLATPVATEHRTLGRIAWHLVTTIAEMMNRTGLGLTKVQEDDPMPPAAANFGKMYDIASKELLMKVEQSWSDADLMTTDDMYGEQWQRGLTLMLLVNHQAHHRGQMTVLMRQAGLDVTGVYGPAKEEWSKMNLEPPTI